MPPPGGSAEFWEFYTKDFLAEHRHPINVGLHVTGTILGVALVLAAPLAAIRTGNAWLVSLVALFPIVHAAPGLIGHRLFERSAKSGVGDVRILRKDFPVLWFLYGNHVMTYMLLSGLALPRA